MPILPPGKTLKSHQIKSLKSMLKIKGNLFLCDKPGQGKTVTTIAYLNAIGARRILIVSKSNGVHVWQKHLHDWRTMRSRTVEYHPDAPFFKADILLTHYHWLSYKEVAKDIYNHFPYDYVVLDEPHLMRRASSQRAKILFNYKNGLCTKAKKVIATTGTLLFNKPIGLYPLLKGLRPDVINDMNLHDFGMRYGAGYWDEEKQCYNYDGASNIGELSQLLESTCMVRGKDISDLENLEHPQLYFVAKDKETNKIIKELEILTEETKVKRYARDDGEEDTEIATLRRELGLKKIPDAVKVILNENKRHKKLLVFAYHKEVIAELQKNLLDKVECYSMHGGTAKAKRTKIIDTFQNAPRPMVLIASITAFNDTITLTASRRPIFVELSFVWNENFQAIMRTRPAMQDLKVRPLFILFRGTYDERMLKINIDNKKIQKEFNQ